MATTSTKSIVGQMRCRMINEGRHKDEFVFTLLDSNGADHGECRLGIVDEDLRDAIEVDTKVEFTICPTAD